MSPKYLIGVDLGTSATKAGLYTAAGEEVALASVEVPIANPSPGVVEQETDEFYATAARAVGQLFRDSGVDPVAVAAIAFDSQMAGIGTIDDRFLPASRFDSWLDMRCQPQIERIRARFGPLVTRLTGCAPTCDHGPKMLWCKEEQPGVYGRTAKFVVPTCYVAGRLAGLAAESAFIDHTFIHFSGVSDAKKGAWSDELIGLLGLDRTKLPRIVAPWEVVGEVKDEGARDFGLAPGTPIAAGCGDTAACALGAGIVRPGMLFDTAGTASVLAGCTDRYVADERHGALLTMRSVVPGVWHPLAYIAGGGMALRWFRDNFWGAAQGRPRSVAAGNRKRSEPATRSDELYDEMIDRALKIEPGAEGLYFSPHLGGRICPASPEMRGAWVGFTWRHTEPHFFRAILESIAFEYAYYVRILSELAPELAMAEARVAGGGAKSAAWNQMKANVLGVPYRRLGRDELGAWGAALVAGKAVGLYGDLAEAAAERAITRGAPLEVEREARAVYAPLVESYVRLQERLAATFRELDAPREEAGGQGERG